MKTLRYRHCSYDNLTVNVVLYVSAGGYVCAMYWKYTFHCIIVAFLYQLCWKKHVSSSSQVLEPFLQVKSWLPTLTDLIYQVCQLPVQLINPAKPCKASTTFCVQSCRAGFWTNESSLWAGLHRKTIQKQKSSNQQNVLLLADCHGLLGQRLRLLWKRFQCFLQHHGWFGDYVKLVLLG